MTDWVDRARLQRLVDQVDHLASAVSGIADMLGVAVDDMATAARDYPTARIGPAEDPPDNTICGWWCLDGQVKDGPPAAAHSLGAGRLDVAVPESALVCGTAHVGGRYGILTQSSKSGTWLPVKRTSLSFFTYGSDMLSGLLVKLVTLPWPTVITLSLAPVDTYDDGNVEVVVEGIEGPDGPMNRSRREP